MQTRTHRGALQIEAELTVIVPVYNAASDLAKCLRALERSSYRRFEVIVVDDGSTQPIRSLVEGMGYCYLRLDGPMGPGRARNHGVRKAQTQLIAFVDADVCVHRDTLARMAQAFDADPALDAVMGAYDDQPSDPGHFSQYRNLLHRYTHCRSAGLATTFWAGCSAIRRDVFLAYGGFDEQRYRRPAIEDIELGTWMAADGRRILLDPAIEGKHLKGWRFWKTIHNDIAKRGVPWVDLMMRSRKAVRTLNLARSQRISTALAMAALGLALATPVCPIFALGTAVALAVVTMLNRHFYRYLGLRRGAGFAARAIPLHWVYFLCCGFSLVLGLIYHWRSSRSSQIAPRRAGSLVAAGSGS